MHRDPKPENIFLIRDCEAQGGHGDHHDDDHDHDQDLGGADGGGAEK